MRAAWTVVGWVAVALLAARTPGVDTPGSPSPVPPKPAGDALLFEPGSDDIRPRDLMMWGLAVSPDGRRAVSTHGSRETKGEVVVWDRAAGTVTAAAGYPAGVRSAAFSPDGTLLVTASYDGVLRLHDPATLAVWASADEGSGGHKAASGINSVALFKQGKYAVTGGLDGLVHVWELPAKKGDGEAKFGPVAALKGHAGGVLGVAVTEDGKTVMSAGFDKSARVWDLPEKLPKAGDKPAEVTKERLKFTDHTTPVEMAAISPDGKLLAYGAWDTRLFVRSADGKKVEFTGQFKMGVMCAAFSPDGKHLAGGAGDGGTPGRQGEVKVWQVSDWKEVAARADIPDCPRGVGFTPDGQTVVATAADNKLHRWAWAGKDGNPLQSAGRPGLALAPQPLLAAAASPDGKYLAVAGESKSVFVYDLTADKLVAELAGHADVVAGLAFSPDGKTLASASYDKTAKLWDVPAWKERAALAGHTGWVLGVAFSPDGKTIATGSYDKTVRLWSVTGEPKATWKDHTAGVRAVAFSPDGKTLATAGGDRVVRLWAVADGSVGKRLKGHKGAVRSLAYSPDGKTLATGGEDKLVRFWDAATGADLRTSPALADLVTVVRFSPAGRTLLAGTFSGPVAVLDPSTGKRRQALTGHTEGVTGLAFADAGRAVLTVSQDKGIRRWKAVGAVQTGATELAGKGVTAVAVMADGAAVLGAADGGLGLWGGKGEPFKLIDPTAELKGVARVAVSKDGWIAAGGPEDAVFVLPFGPVKAGPWKAKGQSAAFSPDGRTVAVIDGPAVTLYDATGKELRKLENGHAGKVLEAAFTPDGKRLVTAGADTKLRLWDVATGEAKQETAAVGNYSTLSSLCVSPDGKRVAVAAYGPDQPPPDNMESFQVTKQVRVYTLPAPDAADWAGNPVQFSPQPAEAETTGLVWVENGASVLVASADGTLRINNLEGGNPKETRRFRAHESGVAAMAATPDGTAVVTVGEDGTARRWKLAGAVMTPGVSRLIPPGTAKVWESLVTPDGKHLIAAGSGEVKGFRVHAAVPVAVPVEPDKLPNAYALAFSPDNKWLVTGHDDGLLIVREAATGKEVRRLAGHKKRVWSAAFAEGGAALVSVGGKGFEDKEPGEALVWDFAAGKVRHTLAAPALHRAVAVHPDGKQAAVAAGDGKVRVWSLADGKLLKTLDTGGHCLAYSPDGKRLAVGNGDGTVKVVEAATGEPARQIKLDSLRPSRVLFSPDGTEVVVAAWRGDGQPARTPAVLAYKIDDPAAEPRAFPPHPESVMGLAFLDKDTLVASGGMGGGKGSLRVYDFATAKLIGACGFHKNWGQNVAASPDGTLLASTSWGAANTGEVRLWRAAGFRGVTVPVPGDWTYLSAGALSPDGKQLVLGGNPKYLAVWDATDPLKPVFKKELSGHAAGLRSVSYAADGKRFVTADDAGLVKVWDAGTLDEVTSFRAAKVRVNRAKFTPDGTAVVTCSGRWEQAAPGEIRLWDPATGAERGRFPDQSREVWDVGFVDGGQRMVTIQGTTGQPGDAPLKVWNVATKEVTGTVAAGVLDAPRSLAVSPDGQHVAVGSSKGPVKVLERAGWQEVLAHADGQKAVFRVEFAPDGGAVVASTDDLGTVVVRVPPKGE